MEFKSTASKVYKRVKMSRICQVDVLDYNSYSCLDGIQKMKCVWNDDSSGHIFDSFVIFKSSLSTLCEGTWCKRYYSKIQS